MPYSRSKSLCDEKRMITDKLIIYFSWDEYTGCENRFETSIILLTGFPKVNAPASIGCQILQIYSTVEITYC